MFREIDGDRGQLTQIFLNLYATQLEALEEQIRENTAQLTISTRVVHHVMIGALRHKTALNIHIVDNGPGIPPNSRKVSFPVGDRKSGRHRAWSVISPFLRRAARGFNLKFTVGREDRF